MPNEDPKKAAGDPFHVAVISDTHIPERAPILPPPLVRHLVHADLILHCGDFTSAKVYDDLRLIAETRAVYGNCDSYELSSRLPEKEIVEVNGKVIGMVHGSGPPRGLLDRVKREFNDCDVVLFGHSHIPLIERDGGVLYANPGSPTDRFSAPHPTYLRLMIGEKIRAELVELDL